jgi:hypothetical protein
MISMAARTPFGNAGRVTAAAVSLSFPQITYTGPMNGLFLITPHSTWRPTEGEP